MTFKKGNQFGKLGGLRKGIIPWNKGLKIDKEKYPAMGFSKNNKLGKRNKGMARSKETRIKISAHHQGIRVEEWNGFRKTLLKRLRLSSKWKIWREAVFLRDDFTCQNFNCEYCNNKIGMMLHPHHIKPISLYPNLVYNIRNGITYCAEFHLKSKEIHKSIRGGKIKLS